MTRSLFLLAAMKPLAYIRGVSMFARKTQGAPSSLIPLSYDVLSTAWLISDYEG